MNIKENQKLTKVSTYTMSGQEEQSPQNQNHNQNVAPNDNDAHERFVDLMMLASVQLPIGRSPNLLDYLYGNRIALVPIGAGGGGGASAGGAGGIFGGLYDIESSAASILARSLYDCCPVKRVITDEARCQIIDKLFTSAMVEELKINEACGIWQEDFEEGEAIKILPCNHAFKAEAIIKWLEEEKAECPICRSSLQSKEVIQNQAQNLAANHEQLHVHVDEAHVDEEDEPAQQDNDVVRVNNIASRLAQSVAGRANQYHDHHHNHHSISVPMNRLIQSVRMASSSLRSLESLRAAVPSSSGAAAAISEAVPRQEVRAEAEPIQYHRAPAYNNIINNNIINNNYYNINNRNNNRNNNNRNNDNNNNNNDNNDNNLNNINNNYEEAILNQEQADIEEAIRRSLQYNN